MKSFADELVGLLTKQASRTIGSATSAVKAKAGAVVCTTLIGMTEQSAKIACATAGYKFRINMKDGKGRMGDAQARSDRIKVDIEGGKVVRAWVG